MNATLLEISDQTACPSRREVELAALVEKLLGEVAQLRGEVADLRQQVGYWKGMFEQAKRKNEKLQTEIDSLRAENRQLKDRLFAAKSEKKPCKDRSNRLDDPKAANTPRQPRGQQPDTPGPQRRDYSHLPVVEEGRLFGLISSGDILAYEVADRQTTIEYLHEYMHGRR